MENITIIKHLNEMFKQSKFEIEEIRGKNREGGEVEEVTFKYSNDSILKIRVAQNGSNDFYYLATAMVEGGQVIELFFGFSTKNKGTIRFRDHESMVQGFMPEYYLDYLKSMTIEIIRNLLEYEGVCHHGDTWSLFSEVLPEYFIICD